MSRTPAAPGRPVRSRLLGLAAAVALVLTGCASATQTGASAPSPSVTATSAAASPTASVTPSEPATPTPTETPSATETPTQTPSVAAALMKQGSTGDDVKKLQARLIQLDWMIEGTVTGTYDQETAEAVEGFQSKRGIPSTGEVDQATWDRLVSMTKEPTANQLNNVLEPGPALYKKGSTGDKVRDIQARLAQLDWYNSPVDGTYGDTTVAAVKGFQDKRAIPVTGEIDQRTTDRLRAMTRTPTRAEMGLAPAAATTAVTLDDRCMTGRVLCIDKTARKLRWVINGQIQTTLDVRFGSEFTPTREGTFHVDSKSRDHVSTIYHTAMPYAMFFSGGQAVHYSSDFAARGYNGASHGCVNVRDLAGIKALFDKVNVGDTVIVYRS